MKQQRPEGITFADVWHSPALPYDETDYRRPQEFPKDVNGYLQDLRTQRDKFASHDREAGDLVTDTSMLQDEAIYNVMLRLAMARHSLDTATDKRTRLFSETFGIEVGVNPAENQYSLAGVAIPNKDFTDDRLGKLRQLEGIDQTSSIPYALVRALNTGGLNLCFSEEEDQRFNSLPVAYIAERLQEALDPAVLPTEKLVGIMTEYGRITTANAVWFHGSNIWMADHFGRHLIDEASVPIDQLTTVILRRLGLIGIRYYDHLTEVLSDNPIEPGITPDAEVADAFIDVDERSLYANVSNMSSWRYTRAMYHELTHGSGAITWRVVDPTVNDGRALQWATGQTRFAIDAKNREYGGLRSNEATTEAEARRAFTQLEPPIRPNAYQPWVDMLGRLTMRKPGLVYGATEFYYFGTPHDKDIELLKEFADDFKNEQAAASQPDTNSFLV